MQIHKSIIEFTQKIGRLPSIDYGKEAEYLAEKYQLPAIELGTEFHSTWLDNTKAKFLLNWKPEYDLARIIDAAWAHKRPENEPQIIWYPG